MCLRARLSEAEKGKEKGSERERRGWGGNNNAAGRVTGQTEESGRARGKEKKKIGGLESNSEKKELESRREKKAASGCASYPVNDCRVRNGILCHIAAKRRCNGALSPRIAAVTS